MSLAEAPTSNWAHLTTVFAQGPDGVVAPMARSADLDPAHPTVAAAGTRFAKVSDLAAAVRGGEGPAAVGRLTSSRCEAVWA